MKISVLTPTLRKEGLEITAKVLERQTFQGFEWVIGSNFFPNTEWGVPFTWVDDNFKGGFWSLNRIYNKMFRKARGELIVSLQDWVHVPPDGLEKFWDNYEATDKKIIISGVGDQYESVNKWGKPQVKIWADPRKNNKYGSFYECYPNDAEWNWCAIPKTALYETGGMDEGLDFLGYGGDQLQVVQRMDELGYKFYLDQSNESFTIRHGREDFGGQENWDKNHVLFNGKYDARVKELKAEGKWPKVDYLQKM